MALQPFLDLLIFMGLLLISYGMAMLSSHLNYELDIMSEKDKQDLGYWFHYFKIGAFAMAIVSIYLVVSSCYGLFFS